MKRHVRDNYYVVGEGILSYDREKKPTCHPPSDEADLRKFRFSRLGPKGPGHEAPFLLALGQAMTVMAGNPDSTGIPAGFTYLGQFVDHDLTQDKTARSLGSAVTVDELLQGRSPALDLDSLYGRGPGHAEDAIFYSDGARLVMGRTKADPSPATPGSNVDLDGFDLPRVQLGSTKVERRRAQIPDTRNDENLAVAQIHLAFMRFHNAVVDHLAGTGVPSALLFEQAREQVVKHYQWMLRTDYLPRIVDTAILDDVFANGRTFFEPAPPPGNRPTMPIEFSVAAFRLGHSMIRESYNWNRFFHRTGVVDGTLGLLFQFSGTSGILSIDGTMGDPESGSFERLPTNWIADFRRLFDFTPIDPTLQAPEGQPNPTKAIDTRLVDVLATLPPGSFGARGVTPAPTPDEHNLAFRNLARANMVELATGQQMAQFFGVPALTADQILDGNGGVVLRGAAGIDEGLLTTASPLWFYILREAEFSGGKLGAVGGRIVAEVFHRAMEGSEHSIVRDPTWRPELGSRGADTFQMIDLLWFGAGQNPAIIAPLG
jgi:hypothetical protein